VKGDGSSYSAFSRARLTSLSSAVSGEIAPHADSAVEANSYHCFLEDYYVFRPLGECSPARNDFIRASYCLLNLNHCRTHRVRCYQKAFRSAYF